LEKCGESPTNDENYTQLWVIKGQKYNYSGNMTNGLKFAIIIVVISGSDF
jgi:hypothetical protein